MLESIFLECKGLWVWNYKSHPVWSLDSMGSEAIHFKFVGSEFE